ncbi:hypothetical protein BCR44DRAFT_233877 [Catenaria anguillulae PL171]|uniref:Uncharacterized protein n=1 Tax=Catenaria anguillulae PL171 TaxID=765915 RepID=A0A1Y2H0M7_9FUNG|nr:hypothetical protein BCR44DRAFT_233877 [Catenaria anguillulae PL171]
MGGLTLLDGLLKIGEWEGSAPRLDDQSPLQFPHTPFSSTTGRTDTEQALLRNTQTALAQAAGFGYSPLHSPTAASMSHHVFVHHHQLSPVGTSLPPTHPAVAIVPSSDHLVHDATRILPTAAPHRAPVAATATAATSTTIATGTPQGSLPFLVSTLVCTVQAQLQTHTESPSRSDNSPRLSPFQDTGGVTQSITVSAPIVPLQADTPPPPPLANSLQTNQSPQHISYNGVHLPLGKSTANQTLLDIPFLWLRGTFSNGGVFSTTPVKQIEVAIAGSAGRGSKRPENVTNWRKEHANMLSHVKNVFQYIQGIAIIREPHVSRTAATGPATIQATILDDPEALLACLFVPFFTSTSRPCPTTLGEVALVSRHSAYKSLPKSTNHGRQSTSAGASDQ